MAVGRLKKLKTGFITECNVFLVRVHLDDGDVQPVQDAVGSLLQDKASLDIAL